MKSKMRWDDDFGDGWEHDVVVEAIEPMKRDAVYPVCLARERGLDPDEFDIGEVTDTMRSARPLRNW